MRNVTLVAALLMTTTAAPAAAQQRTAGYFGGPYFEVTPFVGYVWGGGLNVPDFNGEAGRLTLKSGLGWGAEVGWSPNGKYWLEATYLRQDTDIRFQPNGSSSNQTEGGFAVNYIHLGGRAEFGQAVRPFIGGGAGLVVYDPKGEYGTNTQFSMSVEGGVRVLLGQAQRFGLRGTVRGWFGWVPNGTFVAWCNIWGVCAVGQNTSTVSQGEVSGGVFFTF